MSILCIVYIICFFLLWGGFKKIVKKFFDFIFWNVCVLFVYRIFDGGIRVEWSRGDDVVDIGIIDCVVIR